MKEQKIQDQMSGGENDIWSCNFRSCIFTPDIWSCIFRSHIFTHLVPHFQVLHFQNWDQNCRASGQGSIRKKFGTPYVFLQPLKLATSNLVHKLGLGLTKKRRLEPKLAGVWARGASKKFGTPYLFLQPLKLATSNLVHNLGLGLDYQKATFKTIISGSLGQGSIQKNFGSPTYFCKR